MILAHVLTEARILPAPLPYFVAGAVLLLLAVFVTVAIRRGSPAYEDGPDYSGRGIRFPSGWFLSPLGVLGLLLVVGQLIGVVYMVDAEAPRPNIAPVTVWVIFVLVVPVVSVLMGNWYAALNPWRSTARILGLGSEESRSFGVWPAAVGLAAFGWFQLVNPNWADPITLGVAAAVYTTYLLLAIVVFGRESGLTSFDIFTIYNRLISSIAPVGRTREGRLVWRGWIRALPVVPRWPGLWMFVSVMVGVVLFDGLSGLEWFPDPSSTGGRTVVLLGTIAVVAGLFRLAAPGGDPQRYAHTLVPLAIALVFAHYFSLVIFEGQLLVAAISDPFGLGWDLFGTADYTVQFFVVSDTLVWYIQLASIVIGAATGVVLAHDRALHDFGAGAVRSQYAMLLLMIGLTSISLMALGG